MFKTIIKLTFIFVIGAAGGIFAERFLGPYFSANYLNPSQSAANVSGQTAVSAETKNNPSDIFGKAEKAVVRFQTKSGASGNGVVISSDGLAVTLAELVPQGTSAVFYVDNKAINYQIIKRDAKENLVLIKLDGRNLQTFGFGDFGNIREGQDVFLMGFSGGKNNFQKIVNKGIVRAFDSNAIQTNIIEKKEAEGTPLFNGKGELLGLNFLDDDGKISAIPAAKIKEFGGF